MIGSEDERVNQDVGTPREGPRTPIEARDDAVRVALDHADGYRAYRHGAVEAFLGALAGAGYVIATPEAVNHAAEARIAALDEVEAAVGGLRYLEADYALAASSVTSYNNAVDAVLAATASLRDKETAK